MVIEESHGGGSVGLLFVLFISSTQAFPNSSLSRPQGFFLRASVLPALPLSASFSLQRLLCLLRLPQSQRNDPESRQSCVFLFPLTSRSYRTRERLCTSILSHPSTRGKCQRLS